MNCCCDIATTMRLSCFQSEIIVIEQLNLEKVDK